MATYMHVLSLNITSLKSMYMLVKLEKFYCCQIGKDARLSELMIHLILTQNILSDSIYKFSDIFSSLLMQVAI